MKKFLSALTLSLLVAVGAVVSSPPAVASSNGLCYSGSECGQINVGAGSALSVYISRTGGSASIPRGGASSRSYDWDRYWVPARYCATEDRAGYWQQTRCPGVRTGVWYSIPNTGTIYVGIFYRG